MWDPNLASHVLESGERNQNRGKQFSDDLTGFKLESVCHGGKCFLSQLLHMICQNSHTHPLPSRARLVLRISAQCDPQASLQVCLSENVLPCS